MVCPALLIESPAFSTGSLPEDAIIAAEHTQMILRQRIRRCRELAIQLHEDAPHNPIGEAYERFADQMEQLIRSIDEAVIVGQELPLNGELQRAENDFIEPLLGLDIHYHGVELEKQLQTLERTRIDQRRQLKTTIYFYEANGRGVDFHDRYNGNC